MADNALPFIIFYVAFYLGVAFLGAQVGNTFGSFGVENTISSVPQLSDYGEITVLSYFSIVIDYVIFFFSLGGLTYFGIGAEYALLFSLPLTIGFFWSVVALLRG